MSLFDRTPPPPPAPEPPAPTPIRRGVNVAVEPADGGGFWVTRIRGDAARSATLFTRDELVELVMRARAALEVG